MTLATDQTDHDSIKKTCSICEQERQEKYLSTDTREVHIGNWEMTRSSRYCNDNPECEKASKKKKWLLERLFPKGVKKKDEA